MHVLFWYSTSPLQDLLVSLASYIDLNLRWAKGAWNPQSAFWPPYEVLELMISQAVLNRSIVLRIGDTKYVQLYYKHINQLPLLPPSGFSDWK